MDEISAQAKSLLARVETNLGRMVFMSQMMRNLMHDLLDLAQIERGTFKVNNEYFNLINLIQQAFDMLEHQSE